MDQQSLFKPITKKTLMLTQTARVPEMMREAFRTALEPRRGPVLLNLPRDLLAETTDFAGFEAPHGRQFEGGFTASRELLARAAQLLADARRPLILAGGGVKNSRCHEAVLALAERLDVPVALSPGHGDALRARTGCMPGEVGPRGNAVASDLARRADVILALGTRLGFNTTFYSYDNLNKDARIVQVEADPATIGRFFPVELGLLGAAADVAADLDALLAQHTPAAEVRAWTAAFVQARAAFLDRRDAEAGTGSMPWTSRPFCSRRCATCCPTTPCTPWTPARCACRPPTTCATASRRRCLRRWTSASWASPTRRAWGSSSRGPTAPSSA